MKKKNIIYLLLFVLCCNSLFDVHVIAAEMRWQDNEPEVWVEQIRPATTAKASKHKKKIKKLGLKK